MTDEWNPWNGRNEKPMNALIAAATVSPPANLAGKDPPDRLDIEAVMALMLSMLSISGASPEACFAAALKDTHAWRLMVSTVSARIADGEARESLDAARASYRRTLN